MGETAEDSFGDLDMNHGIYLEAIDIAVLPPALIGRRDRRGITFLPILLDQQWMPTKGLLYII